MTTHPQPHQATLHVVGVDASGGRVAVFRLAHGADPVRVLRQHGWIAEGVRAVETVAEPGHELTLVYAVRPAADSDEPSVVLPVPTDSGLERARGRRCTPTSAPRHTDWCAASAGCCSPSSRRATNAAGRWTLPGGGIDVGESPLEALHREVWEESGQDIADAEVLDIHTQHWIGRAPAAGSRTSTPSASSSPPPAHDRRTRWCTTWAGRRRRCGGSTPPTSAATGSPGRSRPISRTGCAPDARSRPVTTISGVSARSAEDATPAQTAVRRRALLGQLSGPLRAFLGTESASAGLLLAATAIALLWANSPLSDSYTQLWHTPCPSGSVGPSSRWTSSTGSTTG